MAISNPVVNKVFNDLEEFRVFATTELDRFGNFYPFNEADLYNERSRVWQDFVRSKNRQRGNYRGNGNRNNGYKGRKQQ